MMNGIPRSTRTVRNYHNTGFTSTWDEIFQRLLDEEAEAAQLGKARCCRLPCRALHAGAVQLYAMRHKIVAFTTYTVRFLGRRHITGEHYICRSDDIPHH